MRADWTASGACTGGSTAPPTGAARRASGGAATTSTTKSRARAETAMQEARQAPPEQGVQARRHRRPLPPGGFPAPVRIRSSQKKSLAGEIEIVYRAKRK